MVGELLGTYFAIFVVLYTALLANPPLGTFGPVMVGLGFYSSIMTFRTVSGSVLNPGLAVALWLVGMFNPQTQNGVVQYWNIIPYVVFEVSCLREMMCCNSCRLNLLLTYVLLVSSYPLITMYHLNRCLVVYLQDIQLGLGY